MSLTTLQRYAVTITGFILIIFFWYINVYRPYNNAFSYYKAYTFENTSSSVLKPVLLNTEQDLAFELCEFAQKNGVSIQEISKIDIIEKASCEIEYYKFSANSPYNNLIDFLRSLSSLPCNSKIEKYSLNASLPHVDATIFFKFYKKKEQ